MQWIPIFLITCYSCSLPGVFAHSAFSLVTATETHTPAFPGGHSALQAFVREHMVYPEAARTYGIEGPMIVSLIIDSNGKVCSAEVVQKLGYGLDQAVLEMVAGMPPWEHISGGDFPALQRVQMTLLFRLR